jgi:hypothetical protein
MCSGRQWSETCGGRGCRCVGRRRLHFATAMAMQGSCALQAPRPQQTEGRWFAWPCPLPPGLDQQRHAAQGKPGTAHANAKRLHAAAHELGRQAAVSLEAWLTPAPPCVPLALHWSAVGARSVRTAHVIREHSQCGSLHEHHRVSATAKGSCVRRFGRTETKTLFRRFGSKSLYLFQVQSLCP